MNVPKELEALLKAADGLCTGGNILSARHEDRCPRHAATAKLRVLGGPLACTVLAQHEALENAPCEVTGKLSRRLGDHGAEMYCTRCAALDLTPLAEAMKEK
jgi:hypothetical protein